MSRISIFLFLVLIFSACGPSPTVQPPQEITEPSVPSLTQTSAGDVKPASFTPTGTPRLSNPRLESTPTPRPKTRSTKTPVTPGILGRTMIKGVSPDGKWLWEIREQVGSGLSITRILDQDGIEKHRIFFQQTDFPDQEFIEASYSPLFWLPNEPYVYFVGSHCCFDGSIYYHNGFKLSRLNLETGEFTTQVAGSPSQMDSYYFSFSPTGRFFLATSTSPFELKITQLFDMAEKIIQLPKSIEQAGDAIWSQDGRRVILTACEEQVERDCTHFPALVVNVLDGSYKILIPDVGEPVHDVKVVWINDSQAVVTNNDGQKWQIDVDMGIVQEEKP